MKGICTCLEISLSKYAYVCLFLKLLLWSLFSFVAVEKSITKKVYLSWHGILIKLSTNQLNRYKTVSFFFKLSQNLILILCWFLHFVQIANVPLFPFLFVELVDQFQILNLYKTHINQQKNEERMKLSGIHLAVI